MSFRELVEGVERGKIELWRRLYEVPVPPEVVERLRPHYKQTEQPPEYWFVGTLAYRFTRLDTYTQYELLRPFEEYELFCEEVAAPPAVPPWFSKSVEGLVAEYMLARYGYYGTAGEVVEQRGKIPAPPKDLKQLEEAMKRLFGISPDFMHSVREYLEAFMHETHYVTVRPGGLMRLGFHAYRKVEEYVGKEVSDWEMLDWFGSIIMKSPGGPMCRQAVYVWPWLKRWFLETFINLKCDEYKASTVGSIAIEVADALLMIEFLTAASAWAIQRDCTGVEKGYEPGAGVFATHIDAYAEQCRFLSLLRPETRFMELLGSCVQPVIDRCDTIIGAYVAAHRFPPRWVELLSRDCKEILSKIFSDARLLKMLVAYWIYGPPAIWPRLAGELYRALYEATAIPAWRRRHVFRALRLAGEL